MAHLIDKDALVAEIKKRTKEHHSGYLVCLKDILSFLDTLEVKEIGVDLGDPQGDIGVKEVQEKPVSRTPADIEAAMQEVEEKSMAYTEAHQGESSDEILAQMRGEESVSKDLEEAARSYSDNPDNICGSIGEQVRNSFKDGAKWNKANLWKPADGDDLPEIDKEVIVLVGIKNPVTTDSMWGCEVAFAHRPNPNGWDGKSITTGKVEHYDVQTYGKGGWNIPDVKFWLDCELPKIE